MQQERKPESDDKLSKLSHMINRPVVLVGLMGSGKTTIGRRLATQLGLPFADADEEIEKAANRSVSEIFEEFGEEHFRDGERRVIARLCEEKPMIIATGGGAFINDDTRTLIKKRAISIWLDCDIRILAERVSRKNTRPLLRDKDPVKVLTQLAEIRNPIYAEADIRVSSMNGPHGAAVKSIMGALNKWLK
ncbi:shikimate kinase [Parasphingorhabdus sp. DH2-15]|uniref:shikimate kinase n=1 Tax=Parasphingorhabdus sp. DH2-15 TaxID=3444112 RepID=UPI003F686F22